MKSVLYVGMPESIHMARICRMATLGGWRVYLFPCHDGRPNPEMQEVQVFDPTNALRDWRSDDVTVIPTFPRSRLAKRPNVRAAALAAVISRVRPDLVHAHELQHGGYLTTAARRLLPRRVPPVIASVWGSDLSLRARMPTELPRIRNVLKHVDVLHAECERDLRHARSLGFTGETALPVPIAGGFNLARLSLLRAPGPTSARRTIALKGYQSWSGRAAVALRAVALCGAALGGYTVEVYLATPDTEDLVGTLSSGDGPEFSIVSRTGRAVAHEEILALHGRSRVSMGISSADGASTSFLEAITMGSFPIQSASACVDEWIEDGVTGFIVPSDDPAVVAAALREAIDDDRLVDSAVAVNDTTVISRLGEERVRMVMMRLYERVASGGIVRVGSAERTRTNG